VDDISRERVKRLSKYLSAPRGNRIARQRFGVVHHRLRVVGDGVQISLEDVLLRIEPANILGGTRAVDLLDVWADGANDIE